ncbi:ABC transporter substrate-binding protein [Pseudooceanicola sp. CBS1P-1]|uniref:ABC transporter substrate-binding protein n=1 Tax=Pseudooceanicola albus TaxID=2692189 RepID=A0A6L7G8B3_9RHOB|nr:MULTISPECIES: ABC transporter substrate-binding protein [Pseudooceanicola]MBT9384133.1 ABC transporter substrate-binding protein [Pseudooceanicola endophyticus]MXN19768.1 ABC transporter substrate-binding protein [Pseudooceanicola albus]
MTNSFQTRRRLLGSIALLPLAVATASVTAGPAFALSDSQAQALVQSVIDDITKVIDSGQSEPAMIKQFEGIFNRYADVSIIAQSCLGPAARSLSASQKAAYTEAFRGYISRKYGKRFREFIGAKFTMGKVAQVKTWTEVSVTANLRGQSPFEVRFLVSDRSGKNLFFDMLIEGISMRLTERSEIGAMLDKANGNIDGLIKALQSAG